MEDGMLVGILVPLGAFAMVVLVVWVAHLAKKSGVREQAELQRRFLDKFGSGQEGSIF
jgi:hypothetical protein